MSHQKGSQQELLDSLRSIQVVDLKKEHETYIEDGKIVEDDPRVLNNDVGTLAMRLALYSQLFYFFCQLVIFFIDLRIVQQNFESVESFPGVNSCYDYLKMLDIRFKNGGKEFENYNILPHLRLNWILWLSSSSNGVLFWRIGSIVFEITRLCLIRSCISMCFRASLFKMLSLGNRRLFAMLSRLISGKGWMYIVALHTIQAFVGYYPFFYLEKDPATNCWLPIQNNINSHKVLYLMSLAQIILCLSLTGSFMKTDTKKVVVEPHQLPSCILAKIQDNIGRFDEHWSLDPETDNLKLCIEEDLKISVIEDKYLIDSDKHWLICYAYKLDSNVVFNLEESDEIDQDEDMMSLNPKKSNMRLEAKKDIFRYYLAMNVSVHPQRAYFNSIQIIFQKEEAILSTKCCSSMVSVIKDLLTIFVCSTSVILWAFNLLKLCWYTFSTNVPLVARVFTIILLLNVLFLATLTYWKKIFFKKTYPKTKEVVASSKDCSQSEQSERKKLKLEDILHINTHQPNTSRFKSLGNTGSPEIEQNYLRNFQKRNTVKEKKKKEPLDIHPQQRAKHGTIIQNKSDVGTTMNSQYQLSTMDKLVSGTFTKDLNSSKFISRGRGSGGQGEISIIQKREEMMVNKNKIFDDLDVSCINKLGKLISFIEK